MDTKVVVITGASAGIGAALAELVGKRNGQPVLVARREKELAEVAARSGPHAKTIVADVTKRTDVVRTFETALKLFGRVDVWVNNAGQGITRLPSEMTDDDLDEMMLVNVKSVLYGMQTVLPHMCARGTGHIINVSSLLGRMPLATFRAAYSAAKHAMNSLTASFRIEVGAMYPKVHISTVSPGVVATNFGLNARHGGVDSRSFPGAQTAEEVAAVIADVIDNPRADAYTRNGAQEMVAAYYAADDMGAAERRPPFGIGAPPPKP